MLYTKVNFIDATGYTYCWDRYYRQKILRGSKPNVITIGDDGTVGVAVSVRNNLKTRTSLGPVSILRGEEHLDIVIKDILFCFLF